MLYKSLYVRLCTQRGLQLKRIFHERQYFLEILSYIRINRGFYYRFNQAFVI